MRLIPFLCLAGFTMQAGWSADSLQAVYQRMAKAAAGFKGLTADIARVQFTAVINETERQTGTIAVRKLKARSFQYLMKLNPPDSEQVELDNTHLQIYHPQRNTVEADDLGKQYKPLLEEFLLLGFGSTSQELQSGFTVAFGGAEAVAGQPATRLQLTPKAEQVLRLYPRIDVWISDATGSAVEQKFFNPGGADYQSVVYTNMKLGDVPESAVKMNLPKSVKREHLSH